MRFERPVPPPDGLPPVPHRVARQLQAYLDRTSRIEIHVHVSGRRWEKVNVLHLDDEPVGPDDEPPSADIVGRCVKAGADAHAMEVGRSGKYRMVMIRHIGEEDRHQATFPVELETEAERRRRQGIQWSKSKNPWVNLAIAWDALLRSMVRFNERVMDRVLEQQRIRQPQDEMMLRVVLGELVVICEEGLHMQADAASEITEQRMRERLGQARAQLDGQLWEAIAPALEVAVGRLWDQFQRSRASEGDAVGPTDDAQPEDAASPRDMAAERGSEGDAAGAASEPDAERKEGAPPSSDDTPSPGKMRSGA